MLPSPEKFSSRMRKLGIGDGKRVVCYDGAGLFSAARAWWMFKVFGHDDVTVLDGGLPKWRAEGRSLEDGPAAKPQERHFTARYRSMMVRDMKEVAEALKADRVDVAVLHCPTIKPLDEETLLEAVRYKNRLVVVAENHSVIGGLGEAVAGTLLRHRVQPAGFQMAGLPDAFLDAGALPTLHDRYGISRDVLASRIKGWLG